MALMIAAARTAAPAGNTANPVKRHGPSGRRVVKGQLIVT